MLNLEETLSVLPGFVQNEYLKKYTTLVSRHIGAKPHRGMTNKHHIIPKSWFKINKKPIDNDPSNLVVLPYREHVVAHYYLCLCTDNELKFANELALMCLLSRKHINKQNRQLIESLPLYNSIYKDYVEKMKMNYKIY